MLETLERETAPDPTHAVIWLHGLGADGHDFASIVPQLVRPDWPPLRFVFPHAPVRPVTINAGMRMRAWYDIAGFDLSQRQDEPGIRASIAEVEALIAREAARGLSDQQVLLAGFSQGGAIALAAGLRHSRRLAGIIALSCYLPLGELTAAERQGVNVDTPIFLAHGSFDPVVPQRLGEISRDHLRALGHAPDWHSYPMAHQVCAPEISDMSDWMTARLMG
ncbi:MAG: carboxylesterase [Rhodanobacteraceae bacterium]|nr:alpha/beta hydrolase [Pseudomonadota bacterium]